MQSGLGWRWTQYITGIYMFSVLALDVLLLRESYAPTLLVERARRLRVVSQNGTYYYARHEQRKPNSREMVNKFLLKPMQLLGTPICFLFALHASFG